MKNSDRIENLGDFFYELEKLHKSIDELKKLDQIVRGDDSSNHKQFTLDGRLVGDIGETIAGHCFKIQLYPGNPRGFDGYHESDINKKVQVKATFKNMSYFPKKGCPHDFILVKLNRHKHPEFVYYGPSIYIEEQLKKEGFKIKPTNTGYFHKSLEWFENAMKLVPKHERVPERLKMKKELETIEFPPKPRNSNKETL